MAAKMQRIIELMQETQKSLSEPDNWTAFLRTAAWQYKYPFEDQVLIYAQRPDAAACASMEVWNKRMHRWINKGSKGIALLRETGGHYGLEYVFDVSDTRDRYNRELRLWKYDEKYDIPIKETLTNTFGYINADSNMYEAIHDAVRNAVEDNKADYLHEIGFVKNNSLLHGLDSVNLDYRFRQTAEASIRYIVMCRMGFNADDVMEREDLEFIRDFNTPETISILGNAVSSISEHALRNISETIRAEQRREKFDERSSGVYNRDNNNIQTVNAERNENHGRDSIQDSGRLSDTGADGSAGGIHDREIRDAETDISQGAPQEPLLDNADERNTPEALGRDGQSSDRTGTEDSITDGTGRESDGGAESAGSVEVDGADEQSSPFGGGNDTRRTGVQLSLFDVPLPSEEEQRNMIERAEQSRRSAFLMPQQIIDEVLTTGSNNSDSIINICSQYSKSKSSEENVEFLRNEYKQGGKGFIFDGSKVSIWWNAEGMRIAYGDRADDRGQLIAWEDVDKRIGELLELGRFAPQETLDSINEYERKKTANAVWYMYRDLDTEQFPELKELFEEEWFEGGYPDSTARIAELLKQPEYVIELVSITNNLTQRYYDEPEIMRFKLYSPDKVLPMLSDLELARKTFTADRHQQPASQRFITEDEIDRLFMRGSGFDRGKIRIYLYFQEHTDKKERVDFLKNEYGIGGSGGGIFSESHDTKGITFSREDIASPLAKVNISWSKAERRIDSLIRSGRYMTEKEINENIPRYLSEQEQMRIRNEKITYLYDMDKRSPEERLEALPKRMKYFMDVMDESGKHFFTEYGVEHLLNETEIGIADAIKDGETRRRLSECMQRLGETATDVLDRNSGYSFSEELKALKVINLHRVGDFYEMFGDEAVEAAKTLDIALTAREINGERTQMCGVPVFSAERYVNELERRGYIVSFAEQNTLDREEEQPAPVDENNNEQNTDTNIIGRELTINDHRFMVESVGEISGDVALRDITFEGSVGFPISRIEKLEKVQRLLEEQEALTNAEPEQDEQENASHEELTPNISRPQRTENTVLYPEIPMSERHNFRITDDNLGHGTPTEKYRANVEAIQMLKKLEAEHRLATPEEQEVLSRYVGWGGLADCFDERNSHYAELKSLLTDEEYSAARESTLTAFYTPPVVIRSIYKALENMGLKHGNILDPSMGIGNFEGMLPDSLSGCKVYGIELDSISGRIAQQLYQRDSIAVQGYENATLPDSFFDAAVSNVPFGDFKVLDRRYDKNNFLIHDYFFGATRS